MEGIRLELPPDVPGLAPYGREREAVSSDWTVQSLVEDFKAGRITRRGFVAKLVGVGVGLPVISAILAACGGDSGETETAREATPGSGVATTAPQAAGTFQPTKRGGGGQVKVLWWQAPSTLNPHMSSGTKDRDGSSIFYERLVYYDNEAVLQPRLASEVPSQDKGTLDKDLKWVVWKLKKGVTWHDGQPFTAEDVVFTWEYATDPDTAALSQGGFKNIASIEKVDDLTVRVNLKEASIDWGAPFYASDGLIIPKHVFQASKGKEARNAPANLKPVGTGPYKVVDFRPDDIVIAEINNNYHIENRPYFDRFEMKGGGDAVGAARAVLQTGEYDFAWNLQVDGLQLASMEKGGQGVVNVTQGGSIEHVQLNYTDPNVDVDGERSSLKAPHPFFTDLKVRQAFALAMDRKTVVDQLYGKTGEVALFYFYTPKKYVPDATWQKDLAKANQLLDEAGWRKGGDGIRTKDGKRMKVLFQTSVNKLRQDTQAVIKQDLESIGVEVELKAVIADVFFAADPANPDNFPHFYADMQMYTATRAAPDDVMVIMQTFLSSEVRQKANNWAKQNSTRYVSPEFDALYAAAAKETDPTKFAEAVKKMNQKLLDDIAVVPIVARGGVAAIKNDLKDTNISGWASNLWYLPYWNRGG
jgi:peptide/nickel transport system substrate-binding protein